ncbi:TIGR04255 family protein [Glaciecola sp. SC05]|uniref:TIGR04255 family protein n=1 Tax=Glaciecola sp. SC05 TaxID=1987355 RepID=UPI00352917E1
MTWSFEKIKHTVFNRNPLDSTDVELRFHPIVRVAQRPSDIALFQDKVRDMFPKYRQNNVRGVSFAADKGSMTVQDEIEHVFSDVLNRNSLVLNQNTLRASSQDHQNRNELISQFNKGLVAAQNVFGGINAFRLGVRYVNIINKTEISKDLGVETLEWEDLISGEFLRMPHEINDKTNTNFMMEIGSNLQNGDGELTLRYGLIQNHPQLPDHFRFDIDRYVQKDDGLSINTTLDTINEFTDDIYSLFNTVMADKLKQWMEQ